MNHQPIWQGARGRALAVLLASSALCTGVAHAAPAPAFRDLGVVDAAAPVTATVWLAPRDAAGLARAIAARQDRSSPLYHQWMTDADIAAFGPDPARTQALAARLRASGLAVAPFGTDALSVSGPAVTMETVFHTTLRNVAVGTQRFRVTTAAPNVSGADAELVSGVTGLDTVPARPLLVRQINVVTGKPITQSLAAAANPADTFTDSCFLAKRTQTLSDGKGGSAKLTGPVYTGFIGEAPATKTCGYTAAQVVAHYGIDKVAAKGFSGQGQTVVIVDAIGSPSIVADANSFSKMMGLPALTSSNFTIVEPDGPYVGDPYTDINAEGWPQETSLDVEWVHAVAPKAKIVLVTVPSQADDELIRGVDYAIANHLGQVISNSYGIAEYATGPAFGRSFDAVVERGAAEGIAVNASSGDSGDEGYASGRGGALVPGVSPYATSIGGTSLGVPTDFGPVETGWGNTLTEIDSDNLAGSPITSGFDGVILDEAGFYAGSGGGQSVYLAKPSFQKGLVGSGRLVPDIATIADPFTGGIFVAPDTNGSASVVGVIGGTSLACPVFSAMWALADQMAGKSLGQAAPILYSLPSGAINDLVAPAAGKSNLQGTITVSGTTNSYAPSDLLGITSSQPSGFVGTAIPVDLQPGQLFAVLDLSFGTDSSLRLQPGWDNVTGLGAPSGPAFFAAVLAQK